MNRLLIAEQSDVITKSIVNALQDEWELFSCTNGDAAEQELIRLQPDAMVLDLNIPGKRAFDVLADRFPFLPTNIVGIAAGTTPYVCQMAARWGIDYVLKIPFEPWEIKAAVGGIPALQTMRAKRLAQHLRALGVTANHNGYFALLLAIPYLREDFSRSLHKEVYPYVAQELNTDPRSIEHSIRTAIQHAWHHRLPNVWGHYFPTTIDGDVECPKNKAFIVILAQRI